MNLDSVRSGTITIHKHETVLFRNRSVCLQSVFQKVPAPAARDADQHARGRAGIHVSIRGQGDR